MTYCPKSLSTFFSSKNRYYIRNIDREIAKKNVKTITQKKLSCFVFLNNNIHFAAKTFLIGLVSKRCRGKFSNCIFFLLQPFKRLFYE